MVEPSQVRAAGREARRLVLQGRARVVVRLVPARLVVQLADVSVGRVKAERRPVRRLVVRPSDAESGRLDPQDATLERLVARGAEGEVSQRRSCSRR